VLPAATPSPVVDRTGPAKITARVIPKIEQLRGEVLRADLELSACPPLDTRKRWELSSRLTTAQGKLDRFEGVPRSELESELERESCPRERFKLAKAINSL
jgi:hypothetical protein